jgi:hypothetical protein
MNALLDKFADYLPIFPNDVPATDIAHKRFIHGSDVVSSNIRAAGRGLLVASCMPAIARGAS